MSPMATCIRCLADKWWGTAAPITDGHRDMTHCVQYGHVWWKPSEVAEFELAAQDTEWAE